MKNCIDPVRDLSAEAMQQVSLTAGKVFPRDRSFALAQGDAPFDPTAPTHLPKHNYMCRMRNERIAAILSALNPNTGELALAPPSGIVCREDVERDTRQASNLFLKKDRKLLLLRICSSRVPPEIARRLNSERSKSFLLLFFKKEGLAFFRNGQRQSGPVPEAAMRDADPVQELRAAHGHFDLGVYAEVV